MACHMPAHMLATSHGIATAHGIAALPRSMKSPQRQPSPQCIASPHPTWSPQPVASQQLLASPQPIGAPQRRGPPKPVGSRQRKASPRRRTWPQRMGSLQPIASPQRIASPRRVAWPQRMAAIYDNDDDYYSWYSGRPCECERKAVPTPGVAACSSVEESEPKRSFEPMLREPSLMALEREKVRATRGAVKRCDRPGRARRTTKNSCAETVAPSLDQIFSERPKCALGPRESGPSRGANRVAPILGRLRTRNGFPFHARFVNENLWNLDNAMQGP